MKPTMNDAEQAAELLGIDTFDLGVALREQAASDWASVSGRVRRGGAPETGRAQRATWAAEACEAAWREVLEASQEAPVGA